MSVEQPPNVVAPRGFDLPAEIARIDTYALRRSSRDLFERSQIGPVFYVLAWVLLLVVSDYVQRWSWRVALPAAFFVALWWLRRRHRLPADASAPALARWARAHWALIHVGSLVWGLVPAFVGEVEVRSGNAILIAALSTMAFCTAGSHAFATHAAHARVTMMLLLVPGVVVFLLPSHELRSIGATLFVYGFYLLANLRRSAAEYTRQVETEVALLRSRAEVAQLSLTDALTGLANRRSYELAWAQASSAAARQGTTLTLLALDLDHFKSVNDRHGHAVGDACLRWFAEALRRHFRREVDFLARLGGEEFVVMLPGVVEPEAVRLAEALRADVAASPCHVEGLAVTLTVSVGVAALGGAPADTFKRADRACYAAKQAGRDRVVAWTAALE